MKQRSLPASFFGIVLGLAGLGQAWRVAHALWGLPILIGEALLGIAALVWAALLALYLVQALRQPERVRQEFSHPVQGGTPALLGVATLLIALAVLPWSHTVAICLTAAGIAWHLGFSLWHTGALWQGGRDALDTVPTLYLPTVAGNFTSAAALGGLGLAEWGWLFLGAGMFSWLALESLIIGRLWHASAVPVRQRPLLGIQFAPPVVCAMAWLMLAPGSTEHWILMLWGYGLFQLLLGLRLGRWLGEEPFAPSYWAYTFGIAATTVCCLKLAVAGVAPARQLAIPIFVGANAFIAYLALRSLNLLFKALGQARGNTPQV
ncbi:dicarboxylate transporter/tellurite-resistance protein TehA [Uliginosibacterium sp. 31-16]|uniref:dicarboxylate transporter/tellurite-resistance protein TehA n=1 Tax=Uliginosibacterium sp. 31-16 TaxID=3068315 RepID=UPI00273ECDFD|nr:dicarboxylate transporter/tellurite-resistance protein TehA [Uliginosibacterium sp. 31-16]MDP5238540.1 dicarboxylate transporter/tellurite-resistance protein TehA [Uliginosibacterium sp. 31-16]